MAFRIGHCDAWTMVGAILDCRNRHTLRNQILTQRDDVGGGEGDVVHAVDGVRIGRLAVTNPLLANKVSQQAAKLHRRSGSEAERSAVERFHSVWRSSVEGDVIDA